MIRLRASLPFIVLCVLSSTAAAQAQVTKPHPGMTLVEHAGQGAMVVLDLCTPGASIVTTRYADRKATPAEWAGPKGIEAATNADFFDNPGWTYVIGRARAQNEDWPATAQWKEKDRPYWQFGARLVDGVANGTVAPNPAATEIFGGHNVIISGGKTTGPWSTANDGALLNGAFTRTAFGASADRRTVYAISTSDRVTAQTLVTRMQAWAAEAGAPAIDLATNEDGGGSAQMFVKGRGQIVSTGRQVNNHIGFVAKGTGASPMCIPRFEANLKDVSTKGDITLKLGEKVDAFVDVVNTGSQTWVPGVTKLAPLPRDKPSDVGGEGWLAPHRVSTVAAAVKPGAVGRFALPLKPTKAGDFTATFGFVQEGETWFSETELKLHVVVIEGGAPSGTSPGASPGATSEPGSTPNAAPEDESAAESDDGCDVARRTPTSNASLWLLTAAVVVIRRRVRRRAGISSSS